MSHRLTTWYAKKFSNRTLIVKLIPENVATCFFFWDSVHAGLYWRPTGDRRPSSHFENIEWRYATAHPIHFMFGSTYGFQARLKLTASFKFAPGWPLLSWRRNWDKLTKTQLYLSITYLRDPWGFSGSGYDVNQMDPRCHGNEIWHKTALTRLI